MKLFPRFASIFPRGFISLRERSLLQRFSCPDVTHRSFLLNTLSPPPSPSHLFLFPSRSLSLIHIYTQERNLFSLQNSYFYVPFPIGFFIHLIPHPRYEKRSHPSTTRWASHGPKTILRFVILALLTTHLDSVVKPESVLCQTLNSEGVNILFVSQSSLLKICIADKLVL